MTKPQSVDNQQNIVKEKDNLEQMTPEEFRIALEKAKRLSKTQKAGKTIGYIKVKGRIASKKLPQTEDEDSAVMRRIAEDREAGKPDLKQRLADEFGGELTKERLDQMTPEQKAQVKGRLAEPENMEEMMTTPGQYRQREKQEGESDEEHQNKQKESEVMQEQGRRNQLEQALGRPLNLPQDRPMNALDAAEQGAAYSDDRKKRKEQKKESERQIKDDYATNSWKAKRVARENMLEKTNIGGPGIGTKLAGKTAGKAIGAIAEHGGTVSAVLIYGLAIANDFPDLLNPIIEWLSLFSSSFFDFLFDVVIFLGFRYFLRDHINVPGVKVALYVCAIAEILPIPILDHIDIFPFWTLCAWLALRKINQEKAIQAQTGGSRADAARLRQLSLERAYARGNQ